MKIICTFFGLLFSVCLFSQKEMKLENCVKLESSFATQDSSFVYSLKDISGMQIVIHARMSETFEIDDTMHRDFIESGTEKLTLDYLYGLSQVDYTGSYDLMECYSFKSSTHSYCILSFVDMFIVGSNQQVFFVIMKKNGDKWEYYRSYENDHGLPTGNISLIQKRNKLKGKHLKQIKPRLKKEK